MQILHKLLGSLKTYPVTFARQTHGYPVEALVSSVVTPTIITKCEVRLSLHNWHAPNSQRAWDVCVDGLSKSSMATGKLTGELRVPNRLAEAPASTQVVEGLWP